MIIFYSEKLASASLLALTISGVMISPAQAQVEKAAAAEQADPGIADIVVTAQRRTETVQKSSLTIQVLGGEDLRRSGMSEVKDLVAMVPSVQIAQGGNQTQTFIRGVGDFSSSALGQSAVAFSIDGVYVADQASVGPLFYDMARVEVLKGPQGTLYGRNSSAGAINVITNRPTDELSGDLTVDFGNYDSVRTTGAVNIPLGSTLSARAAFQYVTRDGYLSDGTDDDEQRGGRLQLLWKPTERFSALVTGDIEHRGGSGPGAVLLPRQAGTGKFTGSIDPVNIAGQLAASVLPPFLVYTPGVGVPPAPGTTGLQYDSVRDNTQRNISAEFNYDLDFATLTFVPAYRTSENDYSGYLPGYPFINNEKTKQQSYELRLSRNTDRFKAVAGIFYMDLKQQSEVRTFFSPIPALQTSFDNDLRSKSYAVFGQATLGLSDSFRVIAGARYTYEERAIEGTRTTGVGSVLAYDNGTNFKAFTYRTGLEYDLTPQNMVYATISKGFKSGGFNTYPATQNISNAYLPEKLNSYTIGLRNRFFDNRVQFNIEGFYWDLKDNQQSHLGFDPLGNLQFLTFNAASATIYGADADLVIRPTSADTLSVNISYLHNKFDDFVYQIPTSNYRPGTTGCSVTGGTPMTTIDCSGRPLPRAPKWSGTVSYQHVFNLADGSSIVVAADANFATKRYIAVDYLPVELDKSYIRENVGLTYNLAGDQFSITAYVKNISNRAVHLGGVETALAPGIVFATVDAPRTYGIRFHGRF